MLPCFGQLHITPFIEETITSVKMFIIMRTNLWGMEQMHSYVISDTVIISSCFWFTSELLDIF